MSEKIEIPFSKLQDVVYMSRIFDQTIDSIKTESIYIKDDGNHTKEELLDAYQKVKANVYGDDPNSINLSNDFKDYWLKNYSIEDNKMLMPSVEYIKGLICFEDTNKKAFTVLGDSYNWKKREEDRFQDIDGKIEEFKQGRTNDCWLLAGLKGAAQTEKGADIIKNSISQDKDGNYVVNFKGENEKVTVTKEDFMSKEYNRLSTGDPDAKLIEIATIKLKNKGILEKVKNLFGDSNYDDLDMGNSKEIIKYLTGKSPSETYIDLPFLSSELSKNPEKIFSELEKKQKQGNTIITANSYKSLFSLVDFSFTDNAKIHNTNIMQNHIHTIESIDTKSKTITLLGPDDTSVPLELTYEEFLNNFRDLSVTELD